MKKLLVCLCLALGAGASESFLLNIPLREDLSRLTGEVRVTLTLDAPPAGAQLVVNETTTIALGQTVTLNGDSITFEAGAGNQARIVYRVLSNFPTPGNFCLTSLATVTVKEVQMRFAGAQDIVSYRMASYAVGAPDFECSKPFRRVGDFPAFLIPFADATTPELNAINKNRDHLDVVFVLDKSGSMAGPPPVEAGDPPAPASPTKAEILRSAIHAFIAQWRALDGPTDENPGVDFAQDRIGVVFFDTNATPQTVSGGFFVERGPGGPGPTHQWNAVDTHIDTLAPGGSTTIGGGINTAFQQWQSDPDHDLTLIVVTDGMQNTAPLVGRLANDILTLSPVATFNEELRKRFVPIFSIGFGVPAAVDHALLQDLSLQTTGQAFLAINAATMFDSFAQTLVQFIKGNTVSLAIQEHDTMTGPGPSAARPLLIDGSVPRAVVSVQWAPPLANVLDLELIAPDGTVRTPSSLQHTGQAVVAAVDLRPGDAGQWSVRVRRAQSTTADSIPYTLSAFLVERELQYQFSAGRTTTATGEAIDLRATIAFDHKSLGKLPKNAVRVRVQRPSEGLGTILHATRGGDDPASNGDAMSPYEQKVASLTDASLLQRVYPHDAEIIELREEKPGIYTGRVTNTTTPGMYAFEAVLDWDDPRTGHVRRVERLEKHVAVKPDPAASIITTSRAGGGQTFVTITPRDRFGNFVGPGYGPAVRATLNSAGTISATPVDEDQTGRYTFVVTGAPAGETPDVDFTVGVVDAGSTRGGSSNGGKWRAFLDLGRTFPHGNHGEFAEGGFSINGGVERILSPRVSVEAILGHHRFENNIESPAIWQFAAGGKYWFGTTPLRPFLGASAGAFHITARSTTRFGATAGGGVLYELTPSFGIEGVFNYNVIKLERTSIDFSTVQVGMRFSW